MSREVVLQHQKSTSLSLSVSVPDAIAFPATSVAAGFRAQTIFFAAAEPAVIGSDVPTGTVSRRPLPSSAAAMQTRRSP